jgi:hypothetical protein
MMVIERIGLKTRRVLQSLANHKCTSVPDVSVVLVYLWFHGLARRSTVSVYTAETIMWKYRRTFPHDTMINLTLIIVSLRSKFVSLRKHLSKVALIASTYVDEFSIEQGAAKK